MEGAELSLPERVVSSHAVSKKPTIVKTQRQDAGKEKKEVDAGSEAAATGPQISRF